MLGSSDIMPCSNGLLSDPGSRFQLPEQETSSIQLGVLGGFRFHCVVKKCSETHTVEPALTE